MSMTEDNNLLKLKALYEIMRREHVDAVVIMHDDEYLSEELSESCQRLKYLTGFSGSAGCATVLLPREDDDVVRELTVKDGKTYELHHQAALFVDGRYTVQVKRQVDQNLYDSFNSAEISAALWLNAMLPRGARVGIDLNCISYGDYLKMAVLNFLSSKIHTGEPLPKDKLDALIAAKNFQSAMAMLRQLEFAIFDMRLHLEYDESKGGRVQEILAEVKDRVSVVPRFADERFANCFTHIFAGGYAAGYYSYKWAEVLAADAFGRFLNEGLFDSAAGKDFKDNVLAVGGSIDAMKAFVSFRGRKPEVDALLKQSGISA